MRAFLYLRVSTDQQVKEGESLDEQESSLRKYCKNNDIKIIEIYKDEGISGRKNEKREDLQRLLEDVKSGKGDIILFTFLARWFRSLRHYLNVQEILNKNNVAWKAIHQPFFNTQTAAGRAMVAQIMTFNELEAETTSERIKAVFDYKISQGQVVSGVVPLGYKIIENLAGKGKIMIPDENAELVNELFDYFIKCGSIRKTAIFCYEKIGSVGSHEAMKALLSNKKYIGEHRGNPNFCPPIISKEKFNLVQNFLKKNVRAKEGNRVYIFNSLIKCRHCGNAVSGSLNSAIYKTKKDGQKVKRNEYKKYRCTSRKRNPHLCVNKKQLDEKQLEAFLLENIVKIFKDYKVTIERKKTKKSNDTGVIAKLKKKVDRWNFVFINGHIEEDEYKKEVNALKREIAILENQQASTNTKKIEKILSNDFSLIYKNSTELEKRELWRLIIDKMIVNDQGEISIIFLN